MSVAFDKIEADNMSFIVNKKGLAWRSFSF